MLCSISGKPTSEPVLSTVSGHIFDKTLVEQYIEQTGKDPINDQPLSQQDLVAVNQLDPVSATPNNLTSIPNLLSQFQKEWDALLIELFTLRKQLKESREELSILLYRQDAAVRVAAKAVAERDEAKRALEQLATSVATGDLNEIIPDEETTDAVDNSANLKISDEITSQIMEAHSVLLEDHKTNKKKPSFNPASTIKLSVLETIDFQPYLTDLSGFKTAIITSIKPNPAQPHILLISFDNDHAIVFDTTSKEVISKLTPKKKKLVSTAWLQELPVLGFEDGSISIQDTIIKSNKPLVTLLTHPLLPIIISITQSGFQLFYNNDLIFQSQLSTVITSLALHGDGVLLSIGSQDGSILIYDISNGTLASTLTTGNAQKVKQLKFASNGYSLIAEFGNEPTSNTLKIYDLRKELVSFEIDNVNFLNIDYSSHLIYLLKESDDKIEIAYLRYYKKLKTWQLSDTEEDLFLDEVTKLKKKQFTHVVCTYESGEEMVLVENTNQLKLIQVVVN